MKRALIRVWRELDIEEVQKHLLLAGELTANCENCRQMGVDFFREKTCPQCHTVFQYIGFRKKDNKAEELSIIARVKEKRLDLTIVDYEDIKHACGKSKARDLLGM